jgi:micrococcal nuclease
LQVARVVDGDTIQLVEDGKRFSVRLIGIDTPETEHPTKGGECYGPEASAFVKGLLTGKVVSFGTDASQGETDKYGRGLGYVWFEGRLVNEEIVQRGLGREYTYAKPYRYQREFRAAEASARAAKLGLWSEACPASDEFKVRAEPLDGPALINIDVDLDAPASAPTVDVSIPADQTPDAAVVNNCGPGMVWVNGYTRKDGRYAKGYCRRK